MLTHLEISFTLVHAQRVANHNAPSSICELCLYPCEGKKKKKKDQTVAHVLRKMLHEPRDRSKIRVGGSADMLGYAKAMNLRRRQASWL